MKWFQMQEKSAGKKRLITTYYIYKLLGRYALYSIAFFVAFFTFLYSKDLRFYSKKYLTVISKYTNIKPTIINQFKQILSYSISLADKIIVACGDFNTDKIIFDDNEIKEQLYSDIEKRKGVSLIFSYLGNIEILQALFKNKKTFPDFKINVFLSKTQSRIFNDFIEFINKTNPINYIISENFGMQEAIRLKENLDKGDILFIAGDRISEYNSSKIVKENMFNYEIELPLGTFRLAKSLECPIYFISALKQKNDEYKIFISKYTAGSITEKYTKYMERIILSNPFQFYHFYDFFNDYNE